MSRVLLPCGRRRRLYVCSRSVRNWWSTCSGLRRCCSTLYLWAGAVCHRRQSSSSSDCQGAVSAALSPLCRHLPYMHTQTCKQLASRHVRVQAMRWSYTLRPMSHWRFCRVTKSLWHSVSRDFFTVAQLCLRIALCSILCDFVDGMVYSIVIVQSLLFSFFAVNSRLILF